MKLKTLVQEEAFIQECCPKVSIAFYRLKVDNVKTNISHVGMAGINGFRTVLRYFLLQGPVVQN